MATKLKSFSRSLFMKTAMTLMFLASIGTFISLANYVVINNYAYKINECILEPDYLQTDDFNTKVNQAYWTVHSAFNYFITDITDEYGNKLTVMENGSILLTDKSDNEFIIRQINDKYGNWQLIDEEDRILIINANGDITAGYQQDYPNNYDFSQSEITIISYDYRIVDDMGSVLSGIPLSDHFGYVESGVSLDDAKDMMEQFDYEYYFENTTTSFYVSSSGYSNSAYLYETVFRESIVKISYPDEYINQLKSDWLDRHNLLVNIAIVASLCAVLALTSLLWLIATAGRGKDGTLNPPKKIFGWFTEFYLALAVVAVFYWYVFAEELFRVQAFYETKLDRFNTQSTIIGAGLLTALFGLLVLYSLIACVIKLKNKKFFKGTLLYLIWKHIYKHIAKFFAVIKKFFVFIKELITGEAYHNSRPAKVLIQMTAILIIFSLVMLFLFAAAIDSGIEGIFVVLEFIGIGLYVYGLWLMLRDHSRLDKQISDVYSGNYSEDIDYNKKSPFYESSQKLTTIANGFQESFDEKIKAERLKIDLVTNVSHDLKTPLTSIISYIELLSKEEQLSDNAREYVRILAMKSERLKNIVSDVFELAKTTSGDISVEIEQIDIKKLIVQTLADMDDSISNSGLTFRTKLPDHPVYIMSDGKRLYRIMLNLIDNAIKYSFTGTRVFIELDIINENAVISLKNTANYEMNFSKDDVLERFSRGDKSRSTEGSGLGLSIAQGFTIACGGSFDIEIDGDLFKVILGFKKCE